MADRASQEVSGFASSGEKDYRSEARVSVKAPGTGWLKRSRIHLASCFPTPK